MPNDSVTVCVACENRLLREALVRILKRATVTIATACGCCVGSLEQIIAAEPNIILLDSLGVMPAQSTLLQQIRQSLPATGLVMVGMEANEDHLLLSVREGALGYVLRDASAADVLAAIRAVSAGQAVCPPCFSATLFACAAQQLAMRHNVHTRGQRSTLSRREQQIMEMLSWGLTNKEIAGRLHLSTHTVKNHIHRILHKTGATDRTSLMESCSPYALSENMVRSVNIGIG
jgi:DNA-binding NarL/FixJ family response regulator